MQFLKENISTTYVGIAMIHDETMDILLFLLRRVLIESATAIANYVRKDPYTKRWRESFSRT